MSAPISERGERMYRLQFIVVLVALGSVGPRANAFDFTQGDFYGTNYFSNEIVHYSSAGAVLQSMTVPSGLGEDIKGLAFGPDGRLYAVAERGSGFAVLALEADGTVHETYPYASNYIGGNLSYGKITFDNSGHFYVGGGSGVVRFSVGNSGSGTLIRPGGAYDVEALPSGNLLVLENYDLYEVTNAGAPVREVVPSGISFTDNRGVEYDPATDIIYVTMLGHTGEFFQLMKFAGATGQLLNQTYFWYGDDMFLADDGRLIVGSRTQSPGFYTKDLGYLGSCDGGDRMFVTQYIPEPGALSLLALGAFAMIRRRRL
jgi:hypothetical protein